jgi:hypothetical protein
MCMTNNMKQVYDKLIENVESESVHKDGSVWGGMFLPNVGNTRQLAGTLSALQKIGLYAPYSGGDRNYEKVWGYVKMPCTASVVRCADCGKEGELIGHQTCEYPQNHE